MLSLLSWRVEVLHHVLAVGPVVNRTALAVALAETLVERYRYFQDLNVE